MKVEYDSNNSGGAWWLNDDDWFALEKAGWEIDWKKDSEYCKRSVDAEGRWLGALATKASREGLSLGDAITEWEEITGGDSSALGCSCCGTPHSFSATDDAGEYEYYSPSAPRSGERYR